MNSTAVVKIICIVAVLLFAVYELSSYVLPRANALNVRSFDAPVKIGESNFPDVAFREYVAENIDGNHDGFLTPQERDAVIDISTPGLSGVGVSDITGIEFFPYLTTLDLSNNSLDSVDLSKNSQLETLNLKGNKHSEGAEFTFSLDEDSECVTTVYVSADSKVEGKTSKVNIVKGD